jgi:predicted RecA/RadA family phage recombinase
MAQSLQDGNVLTVTAPTGGITNGALVVKERLAGVALNSVDAGANVAVALTGVFPLAAVATGAKAAGARVWHRTTGGQKKAVFAAAAATGASGAKLVIGNVWEAAATNATSVKVRLIGGPLAHL